MGGVGPAGVKATHNRASRHMELPYLCQVAQGSFCCPFPADVVLEVQLPPSAPCLGPEAQPSRDALGRTLEPRLLDEETRIPPKCVRQDQVVHSDFHLPGGWMAFHQPKLNITRCQKYPLNPEVCQGQHVSVFDCLCLLLWSPS